MKIVILTDSTGCPRIYPKSERVDLYETYPYLLKKEFSSSKFWQLSIGNQISQLLIDQARGYLIHWKPDYIVLGTGINDVRPEAFSQKVTEVFRFKGRLSILNKLINTILYMPVLINLFRKHRVTEKQFIKSIQSLKNTFKNSNIIWLEISCHNNYEKARPGILKRKNSFNQKIKNVLKGNYIEINNELSKSNFFTKDLHHFTKQGHSFIAKKIINHINRIKTTV